MLKKEYMYKSLSFYFEINRYYKRYFCNSFGFKRFFQRYQNPFDQRGTGIPSIKKLKDKYQIIREIEISTYDFIKTKQSKNQSLIKKIKNFFRKIWI